MMRVAALSFVLRKVDSVEQFLDHVDEVLEEAYCANAEWMILPENISYELLTLPEFSAIREAEVGGALAPYFEVIDQHFRARTSSAGFSLVAGSSLCSAGTGIVNRCGVYSETGEVWYADKQVLTQYEIAPLGLEPGVAWQQPVSAGLGVAICYDCEFPGSVRAVADAGARVIAIPAFTETEHGYHRVRLGARARALENQCFVAVSSLIGTIGREPVPNAVGRSAIYAPPVEPFPCDGTLSATEWNQPGMAIFDVDFETIDQARDQGDVRNWHDRDSSSWTITT